MDMTDERTRPLRIVRSKHPVQIAIGVVVLTFLLSFLFRIADNENMQWPVIGHYLFDPHVLSGVRVTLVVTIVCQILAIMIGTAIAIMRLSKSRIFVTIANAYLWFFRGTPLLVQLIFWYNLAALFPVLFLGVPFTSLGVMLKTNAVISGFTAAVVGFSLHDGAYMAEIVRAGILSVDPGQREAAVTTGMTESQAMRRIILPQAMRVIVPPTGNQAINLLKATALVAFISGGDLLSNVQEIYAVNYAVMPLLVVATIWYLALVTVATIGQYYLERAIGKGYTRSNGKKRGAAKINMDMDVA
ncbi:amino acid ABC transporter permease [Paraburkholderia phosphatilytica]|uniref:amino acid ABC transporter permease n=1 Tax=Paraburkholderia phosphatilytica TaxID=2282883 RepID=UPI000E46DCB2|nr:amino acid ABC transporter permease [Paraburkholderia phosphatilytica]